jgi:hypothetical protein
MQISWTEKRERRTTGPQKNLRQRQCAFWSWSRLTKTEEEEPEDPAPTQRASTRPRLRPAERVRRPPPSGGGAASSNAAAAAPRASGSGKKLLGPGPSEVNAKKRDRSPTDSEDLQSSRSSRRGSGSSFSSLSFRQKSYLPALYYSTQNKRDSAIKPRILGGGRKFLLLRGV